MRLTSPRPHSSHLSSWRAPGLAFTMLISFAFNAHAAGDPEHGQQLSAVCASCHGERGNQSITPDIPVLAGQHYSYLVRSLKDYRAGLRQNLVMASFVKDLSDQDIEDLAAWYAAQESLLHTPVPR